MSDPFDMPTVGAVIPVPPESKNLNWANTLAGPIPEHPEKIVAIDVTGRRHTLLVRNAEDAYELLSRGTTDSNCWLDTETGTVRYGALAHVVRP